MRPILFPTFSAALAVCLTLPLGLAPVAVAAQSVAGTVQQAEVDPPGRVARLDYFEGGVSHLPAGAQDWNPASINYPLGAGDRIATDAGARAELHLGSTALRLAAQTQVDITTLDDDNAYLTLNEGTAVLRVRTLFPGQHLEVNTANLAFSITQPGEYRVDIEPGTGITRVTVPSGGGVVYGEAGQTLLMHAPQQIRFSGRNLAQASAQNAAPRDGFDQWVASRDRLEDQSVSAQYVSREMVGYQQLDNYGEWSNVSGIGPVWYPRVVGAGWAPYRYGHWRNVAPWGWTWVDDAPWGFAPFHYGRWTQVGPRWAWVPGPIQPRPVYAPALVAFVGGNSGGVNWSLSLGGGQPGVAWFPLAPGEAYRPAYRASPRYVTRINQTIVVNNNINNVTNVYRFQRPDFVTAQRADAFARGRPTREDFHRVAQADLERARVVDRPNVQPERREPPRLDNRGPDRVQDRMPERDWRNDRNDRNEPANRPGIGNNIGIGAMPNGGLGNPPNPLNPDAAQREQLRRLQAEDQRQRSFNSMEERQRAQAQQDAQRRALAEQQQRQMQQGAQFPNANDEAIRRGNEERARQRQERFQRDQRSQNEMRQQQDAQRQAQEQQRHAQQQQQQQQQQLLLQQQQLQQAQRAQAELHAQQHAARQAQEQQRAQQQILQAQQRAQQQQRPERPAGADEPRRPNRPERPERAPG